MPSIDLRPRKRHPRDKRPAREMPFDVALRKFKKACEKAGIVPEKRTTHIYDNPAAKKKKKKAEAISRARKQQRMNDAYITARGRRR